MPRPRRLTTIVKTPNSFQTSKAARHATRMFPTNFTCQTVSILPSQTKLVSLKEARSSQYPRICMPETALALATVSCTTFRHLHQSTPVQFLNPRHQYQQHFLTRSLARGSGRYCNHRSCCCFPHLFIAPRLLLCPQECSQRMSPPLRLPLKPQTPLQRKAHLQIHLGLE